MTGTYVYTNERGTKRRIEVGEKKDNGEYSFAIYDMRCNPVGTGTISENELKEYFKQRKDMRKIER